MRSDAVVIHAENLGKKFQEGFAPDLARFLRGRHWEVEVEPWSPRLNGAAKPTAAEITMAGLDEMFDAFGMKDDREDSNHDEQNGVRGDVLEADYHVAPSRPYPGGSEAIGRALL